MAEMKECPFCKAQILETDSPCPFCHDIAPTAAPPTARPAPAPAVAPRKRPVFPDRVLMALGTMPVVQLVSTVISAVILIVLGNADGHWIGFGLEALGVLAGMVLTAVLLARIFIKGVLNLGWIIAVAAIALVFAVILVILAAVFEGSSMFAGITVLVVLNFVGWQIAAFIAAVRWFK